MHMSFLGPKCPICCKQEYFWKAIYRLLIYLMTLLAVQHSKKSLWQVQRYREIVTLQFWTQNGQFTPNMNIFGKSIKQFPKA